MNLPSLDRLAAAITAFQEIATSIAVRRSWTRSDGKPSAHELDRAGPPWDSHTAELILSEWNDSNDPPEIHSNLDGWHGVIQSQGFRIALTHGNDNAARAWAGVRLGLYQGADGDLGEPIVLEEI